MPFWEMENHMERYSPDAVKWSPNQKPERAVGQYCLYCINYLPPNDCRIVAIKTVMNAWCNVFSKGKLGREKPT